MRESRRVHKLCSMLSQIAYYIGVDVMLPPPAVIGRWRPQLGILNLRWRKTPRPNFPATQTAASPQSICSIPWHSSFAPTRTAQEEHRDGHTAGDDHCVV